MIVAQQVSVTCPMTLVNCNREADRGDKARTEQVWVRLSFCRLALKCPQSGQDQLTPNGHNQVLTLFVSASTDSN